MYHKTMTIKRRLFISNIRMISISFAAFILVARMVMLLMYGTVSPNREAMVKLLDSFNQEMLMSRWILVFGIFTIRLVIR